MIDAPVVTAAQGRIRGRGDGEAHAFLGIPYATAGRWAPPRAAGWDGELDARAFGPVAPQPVRPVSVFSHGTTPPAAEQCLSLNLWRPASGEGGLPVLVWIHGGGFAMGWSGASLYHGARLATRERLVVITINYRLGSLGWLCHPELGGANWGLQDQRAALAWVAEHVASFGGDPARVTVAGQSAGALSIMDHLVAPARRVPFARAVLQSPPVFDAAHEPALGHRWAAALSRRATGATDDGCDAEALRALPAERIVALHEELLGDPEFAGTRGGALPMLDAATLPVSPAAAPAARPDVGVLVGDNADEATFFFRATRRPEPDEAGLRAMVAHLPGIEDAEGAIATARAVAPDATTNDLLVRIGTEAMVTGPTARWATARAAAGARVHRYRVDHGPDRDLGATHTAEVPLLFGTYDDGGPGTRMAGDSAASAAASAQVMAAWGGFCRTGDPGWAPAAGTAGDTVRRFGRTPG